METFMPGERSAMTVLHDPQGQSSQQYGTELLPETYIIDREGRVVARFVNAYDWSRPEVRQLIEFLLSDTSSGAGRRLL
jgi:peroxiredoxin